MCRKDFIAVSAGQRYGLAVRTDGSLEAWGRNLYHVIEVPEGTDFFDVSAGYYYGLALTGGGQLAAWGCDDRGQTGVPGGDDFVAVAAGGWHGLALASVICTQEPAMDFNHDCRVNFLDLAIFLQSWLDCNLNPPSACWD